MTTRFRAHYAEGVTPGYYQLEAENGIITWSNKDWQIGKPITSIDERLEEVPEAAAPAAESKIMSELEEATAKLRSREARHEHMKKVNNLCRKNGDNNAKSREEMAALGMDEQEITRCLNPRYSFEKKGYQTYQLTNNNAEITRLRARVQMLEKKEEKREAIASAGGEQPEVTINGVRIVQDFEADRIQLYFDGKPAENIRAELKRNGFKWAPSVGAWQRKLTHDAVSIAKRMCQQFPA